MKLFASRWIPLAVMIAAIIIATQPVRADLIELTKKVAGTTVHYKVVLPNGYDPGKTYPAILALGGGPQTMNTIDSILTRNFRAEAEKRGYIVVAPAAPDGQLFFEGGARGLNWVAGHDLFGGEDSPANQPRRQCRRHFPRAQEADVESRPAGIRGDVGFFRELCRHASFYHVACRHGTENDA